MNIITKISVILNDFKNDVFSYYNACGTFYIIPSIRDFQIFCHKFSMKIMQEKSVAVLPDNIFVSYSDDKLRVSFASDLGKLKDAMDRIKDFIKNHLK